MARRMQVVGNWKMHGLSADIAEIEGIAKGSRPFEQVEVALCVPATLIERAVRAVPEFSIGAQDVHQAEKGAHTGCISVAMVLDCGAKLTIVGHSERREAQHESDQDVRAKTEAALRAGLDAILCVGESLGLREAGKALPTVERQLLASLPRSLDHRARLAIAYEPIWAIGTGKVATTEDVAEMHQALRQILEDSYGAHAEQIGILYGGSVKPSNAAELFALEDVDGALVGGASLKAADFLSIVEAASASLEETSGAR